jgi:CRP/FNR family transcriptional regulator, anaerobic regulatory protein
LIKQSDFRLVQNHELSHPFHYLHTEMETTVHERLTDYIADRIALSEEEKTLISKAYQIKKLKRKEFLFQQGIKCEIEAFVISGSFRIFYVDTKGLEHVLYFAFPDWWIGDIASFNTGEPAALNAQALEESVVLSIDPKAKEELFRKIPALERLFRLITQKHLTVVQKRLLLSYSAPAAERYQELLKRSPGIEQLVPQHQIASYLGILPESLSRLKKQIR